MHYSNKLLPFKYITIRIQKQTFLNSYNYHNKVNLIFIPKQRNKFSKQ